MRPRNLGFLLARIGFGDDPHPSHVEATREMLAACSRDTTRAAAAALLSLDLTEGLPSIDVPTLVLVGTRRRARRRRATRAASPTSSPEPAWSSTPVPATCSCTSAPKRSTR